MTWAKIAAANTGCETPTKGHSMTWHCDFQPENQAFIENFSLDLAKAKQWSDISIRAGVHMTFSKWNNVTGRKYITSAPPHFTVEFKNEHGLFQNAHVFVDIRMGKNAGREGIPIALRLSKLSDVIVENPEIFAPRERAAKKANFQTSIGYIKVSKGLTFSMGTPKFARNTVAPRKAPTPAANQTRFGRY